RLDNGLLKSLAGRATNVECAHRQLRSGLADLLGGDDSHSFAKLNELAGGEVASITHRAYSATALTSKNGTNLQTFHAHPLKLAGDLLINELIRFDDFFLLIHRISDCLATDTPDNALGQIDHFLVAFVNRAHHDAVDRTAIFFVDDHVLCRVHQFPCQITGVGGLERCVSETFASAVSRNEILEHAEPLPEVRRDWTLDDFA